MGLRSPEMDRRQFLHTLGVLSLGAFLESCAPRSTGLSGERITPTPETIPTIRSTSLFEGHTTPTPETIPTVEKGKGPAGKLLCFTQPEVGYGHDYLEQYLEKIEESEVWLANSDGSEPKAMGTNLISPPVWSPLGDKFAFQRYERGAQGDYGMLLVYNKEGEYLTRGGMSKCPAKLSFSPDGNSIIYSSRFYNSRSRIPEASDLEDWREPWLGGIYQYDLKKDKITQVIQGSKAQLDIDPAISPDGTRFVFVNYQYSTQFTIILAPYKSYRFEDRTVLNPEIEYIDRGNTKASNASIRFQWTPDGKKIVYMLEKTSGNSLYIADVSKGPRPQLLEIKLNCPSSMDKGSLTFSKWNYYILDSMDLSLDGKQIVVGCPGSLFLTDIEGGNKRTIKLPKTLPDSLDNVRWLSGNNQIAFVHKDKYYYINSDGSGLREVSFVFKPINPPTDNKQLPLGFLISTGS